MSQLAKSLPFYRTVIFIAELKENAIGLALNKKNIFGTVASLALGFILISFKTPKCH
jgi:putative AlgH/UPF0301 family transcriptional regulator